MAYRYDREEREPFQPEVIRRPFKYSASGRMYAVHHYEGNGAASLSELQILFKHEKEREESRTKSWVQAQLSWYDIDCNKNLCKDVCWDNHGKAVKAGLVSSK